VRGLHGGNTDGEVVQGAEAVRKYGRLALCRLLSFRIDRLVTLHVFVTRNPRDVELESASLPF
jgi:hypothetical protein